MTPRNVCGDGRYCCCVSSARFSKTGLSICLIFFFFSAISQLKVLSALWRDHENNIRSFSSLTLNCGRGSVVTLFRETKYPSVRSPTLRLRRQRTRMYGSHIEVLGSGTEAAREVWKAKEGYERKLSKQVNPAPLIQKQHFLRVLLSARVSKSDALFNKNYSQAPKCCCHDIWEPSLRCHCDTVWPQTRLLRQCGNFEIPKVSFGGYYPTSLEMTWGIWGGLFDPLCKRRNHLRVINFTTH